MVTLQDVDYLRNYYSPLPEIVSKLPDHRTVVEFKEVLILQANGSYNLYKMIKGSWFLVANLIKV